VHRTSPWPRRVCSCRSAFAGGHWSSSSPYAAAFGTPVPSPRTRRTNGRLAEYASFTRARAEEALRRGKTWPRSTDACTGQHTDWVRATAFDSGCDPFQGRWRRRASSTGTSHRFPRHCGRRGDHPAVRLRADVHPQVCRLVSALDRGLMAGLARGGELSFRQRITEGATAAGPAWKACAVRDARVAARRRPRAIVVGSGAGGRPRPSSCREAST